MEVEKKVIENVMFFCSPNFWGIYKSTLLPTYMLSLVEIPWLVFRLR